MTGRGDFAPNPKRGGAKTGQVAHLRLPALSPGIPLGDRKNHYTFVIFACHITLFSLIRRNADQFFFQ
jgi:hypothetical protein